ncbi:unnamed protein product [Adineta steineri]|uniref:MAM domain-containing protein n=1 Tax=Adineta steineri TaxID=433720 RepID=A0A819D611_9BILA|nr:unnamed protein product [Adineta steineri]CAF3823650.1 unnamed protein product [Adineta steineri]
MMTSMLNHYKQWWIVNDINGSLSQLILLDEQVREIERINSDGLNVALVDLDKIAFLNDLVHIFIVITYAQILYQCNFDNDTIITSCLKPEQLAGVLISEQLGSAGIQPPIAPLSDVTSSLKPTTNGESCNLPYQLNSFTWDMYFCNEGYCQTSTDSTSKCSAGKFGYFNFQAPRKVSFTLNTDSGGTSGTDQQCLIYYYYLSNVTGTEQSITVRKQEVGDISETIDTVTHSPYNGWIKRSVSFHTSKSGYKIYFDFERISGPNSVTTIIAIDEISVLQGNCLDSFTSQSSTTTKPISTTTTFSTPVATHTTFTSSAISTIIPTTEFETTSNNITSNMILIFISFTTILLDAAISSSSQFISGATSATYTSMETSVEVVTQTGITNPSNTTAISSTQTTPSVKVYIIILATVIPVGTVAIVILILWIKKPMPFKKSKVNVLEMNQVIPAPI